MFERVFGNPHYKLVALLAAVVAWLYVQSDEVATGQLKAQVEWRLAEGLVSVQTLPRTVALRVRGTRAAIRRARNHDIDMQVDLRDAGPGEHTLDLASFPVEGLEEGLEVLSRTPSGVTLSIDKQVSRKMEVSARIVGKPADGMAVRRVTLRPGVVEVSGPASVVGRFDGITTEPIDVGGRANDFDAPVALGLPATLQADVGEVRAQVQLVALNEQRVIEQVPVKLWNRSGAVRPAFATVELTGPSAMVRDLEPEDVVVFLHAETGSQSVTFGQEGPDRVRVLHGAGPDVRASAIQPTTFEVSR